MKIIALITARSGSKRLPGKNIKPLGGKPLIAWSIELATRIREFSDVIVSTDGPEIADISREYGAKVPWLRPADLSNDSASSVDVCLHAIDWYENENGGIDGIVLLQPTSPFRSYETVIRGLELFRQVPQGAVVGVSINRAKHPARHQIGADGKLYSPADNIRKTIKGDNEFVITGSFYALSGKYLKKHHAFYGEETYPLVINSRNETLDIDDEWDWMIAEGIVSGGKEPVCG